MDSMMTSARFESWLRIRREESELSQQDLADLLGMTQPVVSLWETGRRVPNQQTIKALEELFGDKFVGSLEIDASLQPFPLPESSIGTGIQDDTRFISPDLSEEGKLAGTSAEDWILETPRGELHKGSWRQLVAAFLGLYGEQELLVIAQRRFGRVPLLIELPLPAELDPENYAQVSDKIAVYQKFKADRALAFCRWLSQQAGDRGDLALRRATQSAEQNGIETRSTSIRRTSGSSVYEERGHTQPTDRGDWPKDQNLLAPSALDGAMRAWRSSRGLTQAQAAERIGCTAAAWGHWERGLFEPSEPFRSKVIELLRGDKPQVSGSSISSARGRTSQPKTRLLKEQLSPLERNHRLLNHLATFGELAPGELEDLGLDEDHLGDWLDSLLVRRPNAYVVTPLFLHLTEGDIGPYSFTTRLAAHFMGEHLRRVALETIPELEEHVWTRFGRWHLTQPDSGDQKTQSYLSVPILESRDVAASERLDLFAQLPPKVIRDLIREPEFLTEQQSWSADAAMKSTEGPLSTQLRSSWKRPLMLSVVELIMTDDGKVLLGEMGRPDVVERRYVVGGLPLCGSGDWEPAATLESEAAAERICRHPIAGAILQFEVHRLFAGLSGDAAAKISIAGGTAQLELDGIVRGPLWRHVRSLLEQVGYWPVSASTQDSLWTVAVQMMLKNLELLDVLERKGDVLQLTDAYQSKIKAHPGHPQNRGEKPFRVRLSQFLAALQGGQA